jgi:hypothetical protein
MNSFLASETQQPNLRATEASPEQKLTRKTKALVSLKSYNEAVCYNGDKTDRPIHWKFFCTGVSVARNILTNPVLRH